MAASAGEELLVTVFTDYICPFCYVGDARLSRLREYYDLKVNWFFIEIHPETPPEGRPISELGYAPEQWRKMTENLARMAEEEGLVIGEQRYTSNSHRALLLAQAAKEEGRDIFYTLHHRLFRAYFSEGRNIGDEQVLRSLARESGVAENTVERAWSEPRYEQRLKENLALAAHAGITGTPAFAIGNRMLVGAVPVQTLLAAARESQAVAGG